jgi:oligopeptide/dipeptide ABC transporter ATP-binding protein
MALLEAEHIVVHYVKKHGASVNAVRDVSLSIQPGEFVALVGESGCGKSTLGFALLNLLNPPARLINGRVVFDGTELTGEPPEALRRQRWRDFSVVLQSGMNALNPVLTIGEQFRDVMEEHEPELNHAQIRQRTAELLAMVHLDASVAASYPHELSGGMKQRVAIALALALHPKWVLLDEPTTALDVVVQRSILDMLRELQKQQGFAVLLISHDLGLVLDIADRVMVMYAGKIVEVQSARDMLTKPLHPYSEALIACYADPQAAEVDIHSIPGGPPDLSRPVVGCPFAPRCAYVMDRCKLQAPALVGPEDQKVACFLRHEEVEEPDPWN